MYDKQLKKNLVRLSCIERFKFDISQNENHHLLLVTITSFVCELKKKHKIIFILKRDNSIDNYIENHAHK